MLDYHQTFVAIDIILLGRRIHISTYKVIYKGHGKDSISQIFWTVIKLKGGSYIGVTSWPVKNHEMLKVGIGALTHFQENMVQGLL